MLLEALQAIESKAMTLNAKEVKELFPLLELELFEDETGRYVMEWSVGDTGYILRVETPIHDDFKEVLNQCEGEYKNSNNDYDALLQYTVSKQNECQFKLITE